MNEIRGQRLAIGKATARRRSAANEYGACLQEDCMSVRKVCSVRPGPVRCIAWSSVWTTGRMFHVSVKPQQQNKARHTKKSFFLEKVAVNWVIQKLSGPNLIMLKASKLPVNSLECSWWSFNERSKHMKYPSE